MESSKCHLGSVIVRDLSIVVSNYRSRMSLDEYCKKEGVIGLAEVDTRALTKKLRETGCLVGVVTTEDAKSDAELVTMAKSWTIVGKDLLSVVSCTEPYEWNKGTIGEWEFNPNIKMNGGAPYHVSTAVAPTHPQEATLKVARRVAVACYAARPHPCRYERGLLLFGCRTAQRGTVQCIARGCSSRGARMGMGMGMGMGPPWLLSLQRHKRPSGSRSWHGLAFDSGGICKLPVIGSSLCRHFNASVRRLGPAWSGQARCPRLSRAPWQVAPWVPRLCGVQDAYIRRVASWQQLPGHPSRGCHGSIGTYAPPLPRIVGPVPCLPRPPVLLSPAAAYAAQVVAYDFGIKSNILRRLASFGCRITVVPATYPAADVLKMNPDGVFFSNGPVGAPRHTLAWHGMAWHGKLRWRGESPPMLYCAAQAAHLAWQSPQERGGSHVHLCDDAVQSLVCSDLEHCIISETVKEGTEGALQVQQPAVCTLLLQLHVGGLGAAAEAAPAGTRHSGVNTAGMAHHCVLCLFAGVCARRCGIAPHMNMQSRRWSRHTSAALTGGMPSHQRRSPAVRTVEGHTYARRRARCFAEARSRRAMRLWLLRPL